MEAGLHIRCFTPADIQAVFELEMDYARAFPGALVIPAEAYLSPGFHAGQDVFCAYREGRLAAYAPLYVQPVAGSSEDQPHIAWAEIKTHPEMPDARPVRDALLAHLIERARSITAEASLARHPIRMMFEYHLDETPAIAYMEARGFRHVQSAFQMARDLTAPITAPPLPQGFRMDRWKMESEDEQRAYVDARNECFPQAPITLENWQYYQGSEQWESGTTIACFKDGELVGNVNVYWTAEEVRQAGAAFGYTEDIFVRPAWRGRGIARAMVAEGMRFLREKGMVEARLTVAAQNESALGLYRGLGYRVTQERRHYAREI